MLPSMLVRRLGVHAHREKLHRGLAENAIGVDLLGVDLGDGRTGGARPRPAPSDGLRTLYEQRAAAQYAAPAPRPDPVFDRKFAHTLELLEPYLPCREFLDAGCGDGRFLVAVGRRAVHPVGVDIAARILETADAALRQAGLEADLQRANLERLPFAAASFDLVVCSQVLEHLLDPGAGLRELARVLRPGGVAVLTTLNRTALASSVLNAPRQVLVGLLGLRGRRAPLQVPETSFSCEQFRALVTSAGLVVEHLETFRFHLRWPLDRPTPQKALNALDARLPPHRIGDILAVIARKGR